MEDLLIFFAGWMVGYLGCLYISLQVKRYDLLSKKEGETFNCVCHFPEFDCPEHPRKEIRLTKPWYRCIKCNAEYPSRREINKHKCYEPRAK